MIRTIIINRNLLVLFCAMYLLAGCNEKKQLTVTDTTTSGVIKISVDESFKPVIEAQVKTFEGSFPDAKIMVEYKSEAACLKDLISDSSTRMIIVTRGLSYKEAKYFDQQINYVPKSEKIASDAIAIVLNIKSKDSVFTLEGLKQLLSGEIKNNKKIVFDGLSATSTVRFAMDSILKGKKFDSTKVKALKTSQEVLSFVAADTNAIGLVGISWIGNPEDSAQVNMLRKVKIAYVKCDRCVDSPYVMPTQVGIMSRRYPLVRGLYYILKENYSGLGSGFAGFMQYERGQLIFRRAYLAPAKMSFTIRNVHLNQKLPKE